MGGVSPLGGGGDMSHFMFIMIKHLLLLPQTLPVKTYSFRPSKLFVYISVFIKFPYPLRSFWRAEMTCWALFYDQRMHHKARLTSLAHSTVPQLVLSSKRLWDSPPQRGETFYLWETFSVPLSKQTRGVISCLKVICGHKATYQIYDLLFVFRPMSQNLHTSDI